MIAWDQYSHLSDLLHTTFLPPILPCCYVDTVCTLLQKAKKKVKANYLKYLASHGTRWYRLAETTQKGQKNQSPHVLRWCQGPRHVDLAQWTGSGDQENDSPRSNQEKGDKRVKAGHLFHLRVENSVVLLRETFI